MRAISVLALCIVSTAVGAGIDHYWDKLPWVAKSTAPAASPSQGDRDEVLGDRVRCDVRYQELKLPENEYRAFFEHCMGNTGSTNK
jgi:hypothetical protein